MADEAQGGDSLNEGEIDVVGTTDETSQETGNDRTSLGHEVLNITPPQLEIDARDVRLNGKPFCVATPPAVVPAKEDFDPKTTAARTRPRPPHLNGRKLIRVQDGGYNAANDDVLQSGATSRLGQVEAPPMALSWVVTGHVTGQELDLLVDSGYSYSTIAESDFLALRSALPADVWNATNWYERTEVETSSDPAMEAVFKGQHIAVFLVELGALGGFSTPFIIDKSNSPRTAIGHNVQRQLSLVLNSRCDLCNRHSVCLQGTFQDPDGAIGRACIDAKEEQVDSKTKMSPHPFRLGVAHQ